MSQIMLTHALRHLPPCLIFDVRQNKMKATLTAFLLCLYACIAHAGILVGSLPTVEPGSFVICLDYKFEREDDFAAFKIKESYRYRSAEVTTTRSWGADGKAEGRFLAIYVITPKQPNLIMTSSDFEGLPENVVINREFGNEK